MTSSLDEYRCKLINTILLAGSQEEVTRFCDAALKSLDHYNVFGCRASGFVEKMINDLDQFNPMDKDAQQWSNIRMARIIFRRIKRGINTPAD